MEHVHSYTLPKRTKNEVNKNERPSSFHATMRHQVNSNGEKTVDTSIWNPTSDFVRSLSQANALSTTVPQNIRPHNLAERHTPTRNSLRHSRMIVLSQTGKIPRKYLPPVMRYHGLAAGLLTFQCLLGTAVLSLSVWLLLWAPHIRFRDVPHYSGGPLIVSGVFGLLFLCCCRKEYLGMKCTTCVFIIRVISVVLAIIASIAAFCASVFAGLHLFFLSQMSCESTSQDFSTTSCICKDNSTSTYNSRIYRYEDLSCLEVDSLLKLLILGSCICNGVAGWISTWYIILHWVSRYMYVYSNGKMTYNYTPIIIRNRAK